MLHRNAGKATLPADRIHFTTTIRNMAAKKSSPEMAFVLECLKRDRSASYADVRDAAAKKKMTIYPIVYGRAQALLGIVKLTPRGQGKTARAKAAVSNKAAGGPLLMPRGPGRPARASGPAPDLSSLEGIIQVVKTTQVERDRYRNALERISGILQQLMR